MEVEIDEVMRSKVQLIWKVDISVCHICNVLLTMALIKRFQHIYIGIIARFEHFEGRDHILFSFLSLAQ